MRVLVVDDERMVRQALVATAEAWGAAAFGAPGMQEAMALFAEHEVDLVITDINMPGGDGLEVLRAVKERRPEVPVVIISGYATMENAMQALNLGAYALLEKPVMHDALLHLLEQVEGIRRLRLEKAETEERDRANAAFQRLALEREQRFNNSIIRNMPMPICLIDWEGRVCLANLAFRDIFAGEGQVLEGQILDQVLPKAEWDPFVPEEAREGFSGALVQSPSYAGNSTRYFQVILFPVSEEDPGFPDHLSCVLLQDVTDLVRRERQRGLRQWRMNETYGFMALTRGLGSTDELPGMLADYLGDSLRRFNPVSVRVEYLGRKYACGPEPPDAAPYLRQAILVRQEERGVLAVYGDRPVDVEEQEELVEVLLQETSHRIESGELELQLIHSGRLHSLGEMAAGVAHELNQPLSGIRTFAEATIYGLDRGWALSPEEIRHTLADIVAQVDRMTGIIDQMRSFARRGADEVPVAFDLEEVVARLLALVGAQLRVHQVQVQVELPADLPQCRGWPNQVEQVLLNLVTNARQAMDTWAAKGSNPDWKPVLGIRAIAAGSEIKVAVSDNGGGIPEEIVDRIFEPFFTSKKASEGTGLGLSISRNIARNHGGDLEVENDAGQGVTFWLSLPVASGGGPRP